MGRSLLEPAGGRALLEQEVAHPIALDGPAGDIRRESMRGGDLDPAVQREPAVRLRVREMARLVADLPDALIGELPALAHDLDEAEQELPVALVERTARLAVEICRFEELAIGIELHLLDRAVADANRCRPTVAGKVKQLALGQRTLAGDAVHDLEILRPPRAGALEPELEVLGLLHEAEHEQRGQRQRRIADPRVAIVPVTTATDLLGQA